MAGPLTSSSTDRQIAVCGDWAVAADPLQWILQRRYVSKGQPAWRAVSFVSSHKAILERVMREKGVPPEDARHLLKDLPSTFAEWAAARSQGCIEHAGALQAPPSSSAGAEAAQCSSQEIAP
jgi:hypothetical protein